jgi:heme/copper-type cytochrome/quinol oxidase subunit 3
MSEVYPKEEHTEHTSWVSPKDSNKMAFWVFLGGEVIIFGSLIGSYILFRTAHPQVFADIKQHLSVPLIAVNTFILILSSYFVVRALESIRDGSVKGLRLNLLIVLGLGALFLGGQAYEWTTLFSEGVSVSSPFGTPFFTTTGIHGTHVFIGLIWSLFIQLGILKGNFNRKNYRGVEVFGLYWHFVDIVWIVLFTLFYLV